MVRFPRQPIRDVRVAAPLKHEPVRLAAGPYAGYPRRTRRGPVEALPHLGLESTKKGYPRRTRRGPVEA